MTGMSELLPLICAVASIVSVGCFLVVCLRAIDREGRGALAPAAGRDAAAKR